MKKTILTIKGVDVMIVTAVLCGIIKIFNS